MKIKRSKSSTPKMPAKKDPNRYPKGLNRKKVRELIEYYENQTDDEAIAEAKAAYREPKTTMMQIFNELVPNVQKLISKRAG